MQNTQKEGSVPAVKEWMYLILRKLSKCSRCGCLYTLLMSLYLSHTFTETLTEGIHWMPGNDNIGFWTLAVTLLSLFFFLTISIDSLSLSSLSLTYFLISLYIYFYFSRHVLCTHCKYFYCEIGHAMHSISGVIYRSPNITEEIGQVHK